MRNGKSAAGHQRYLYYHCRKTWQLQFTYTASQPGTHEKIIDMAMNGVGCGQPPALWALASTRFSAILKNSGRSR
ncbi:IS1-like element transposase [Escherichia coli]|uniref:IS1-like element transposase n=1 Tax=Escherichia coli TaxID=562 RepID=UPI003D338B87